ncbi:hypothetical protein A3Q56_07065 [Intoshia linei]|uniref:VPS10 domain-containing protein n=1 Tax=Intoshia linei TaxID=1819745 RepID=A0A177ATA6_9BILA|nr:hypothetical protein A3Q56_07065 [Intoshia linei]
MMFTKYFIFNKEGVLCVQSYVLHIVKKDNIIEINNLSEDYRAYWNSISSRYIFIETNDKIYSLNAFTYQFKVLLENKNSLIHSQFLDDVMFADERYVNFKQFILIYSRKLRHRTIIFVEQQQTLKRHKLAHLLFGAKYVTNNRLYISDKNCKNFKPINLPIILTNSVDIYVNTYRYYTIVIIVTGKCQNFISYNNGDNFLPFNNKNKKICINTVLEMFELEITLITYSNEKTVKKWKLYINYGTKNWYTPFNEETYNVMYIFRDLTSNEKFQSNKGALITYSDFHIYFSVDGARSWYSMLGTQDMKLSEYFYYRIDDDLILHLVFFNYKNNTIITMNSNFKMSFCNKNDFIYTSSYLNIFTGYHDTRDEPCFVNFNTLRMQKKNMRDCYTDYICSHRFERDLSSNKCVIRNVNVSQNYSAYEKIDPNYGVGYTELCTEIRAIVQLDSNYYASIYGKF